MTISVDEGRAVGVVYTGFTKSKTKTFLFFFFKTLEGLLTVSHSILTDKLKHRLRKWTVRWTETDRTAGLKGFGR